ncbi:hypothetical protein HP456_02825 [Bacillus haikouensis]|nr:hypothetical protein [Bacillus haikouensis]
MLNKVKEKEKLKGGFNLRYYNPEVRFLLMDHSDEKSEMLYDSNPHNWKMPKIGPRPPYYCHPRYEQYYPVI